MDKARKPRGKFVEAGKDTPKLLEFVEKTFDEMAFAVEPSVVIALDFGTLVRRDDRNRMILKDEVNKSLSSISSVRNDVRRLETPDERFRLGNIMTLTRREPHTQWIAQGIYTGMDFAGEPASAASEGLSVCTTVFFSAPAALGCARTIVASTSTLSISASAAKWVSMASQIPASHHRANRRYTLFHFPYSLGSSRHCAPLRSTHNTPSRKRRQPRTLPILTSFRPRRYVCIFAHSLSFSRTLFMRYKSTSFVHTT